MTHDRRDPDGGGPSPRGEHPCAADVDWLIGRARTLEAAGAEIAWAGGETVAPGVSSVPFVVLPEVLIEFLLEVEARGLLRTDYQAFVSALRPALDEPERIAELSLDECLLLLTYHVRTDRFVDGHLAAMLRRGDLSAILHRLSTLRRS